MIQQAKEKHWIDVDGTAVPKKYIDATTLKKERVVGKVLTKTLAFQKKAVELKESIMTDCDDLYFEMAKQAGVKIEERKGNYQITSFDKEVKIEMKVSDRIEFDEHINFAQAKIQEFLAMKTAGIDTDLSELINSAFQTKKNRLDTKSIFKLFTLKIKHPIWDEAMDLIKKSIQKNKSVRYLTIFEKDDEGKYKQIQLNFSAL
ncbi:DUF3164 family protein [uncultured Draconibacterium sp.]|uniref:DUF3164 family protein n=1 Tax=uncultured Draconibacterium sp. TaxID=1573823 RepID=UPI003216FE55